MDNIKVNGSFISEKVSKIRWLPEQYTDVNKFLTGSWFSSNNHVKLWKLVKNEYSDDENEFIPNCCDKIAIPGDVSGLEFIDFDNIAVSSTEGFVSIINIKRDSETDNLSERKRSDILHKFECETAPCTGISVFEKDIASVGEDGRLNILSTNGLTSLRQIDNADNCTITAVSYVNHKEILTGNTMGVMKMFDLRSNKDDPSEIFLLSCEDDKKSNAVTCICYHPTQRHIILAGSEEGSITVWDLRQPNFPASYLSAHTNPITELGFHKTQPTKLFTASENGELWQWNQNTTNVTAGMDGQMQMSDGDTNNPFLNGERAKSKINVTSLITGIRKAINSFDAQGSKIICGCDSEAIYYIDNMF